MFVLAIVAALLPPPNPAQEDGADAAAAAVAGLEKDAKHPVAPLSASQWQSYIESFADAPDNLALALDRDGQLRRIFAPYFQCYRGKLDADAGSDLQNAKAARTAFQRAYIACRSVRDEAEGSAHKFAASFAGLHNSQKRQNVIDYYRLWQGERMLRDYYKQRGKLAQFNQISEKMNSTQRVEQ